MHGTRMGGAIPQPSRPTGGLRHVSAKNLVGVGHLHLQAMPWARIAEFVGQRDLSVTAGTYTHAMIGETDLDDARLLG